MSLLLGSKNSSVVEGEHGGDGGEPDAGDEEGVPDLGLVVALQGKGVAYRSLSAKNQRFLTRHSDHKSKFPFKTRLAKNKIEDKFSYPSTISLEERS